MRCHVGQPDHSVPLYVTQQEELKHLSMSG